MLVLVLAFIVSLIPLLAVYLWLRNRVDRGDEYKKLCDKSFVQGMVASLPIMLFSGITSVLLGLTGLKDSHPLLYVCLHDVIVLALVEEVVKLWTFLRISKKTNYRFSWLDVTVMVTIVATGFGFLESFLIAIGANVPTVLLRGISFPHVGYGFLVGYFYGKGLKTGNTVVKWTGFLLAWFVHGLYDFSLSPEFLAINDNLVFVPFILVAVDIALAITLFIFTNKARKNQIYLEPIDMGN